MRGARRSGLLVVLALVAGLLAGPFPTPSGVAAPNRGGRAAPTAEWTVMIYLAIDNDLDGTLFDQVLDAARAQRAGKVNVVALVDRSPQAAKIGDFGGLGTFTDTKLIEVDEGSLKELKDLGEVDMGSDQTLAWFIAESVKRYPAQHYSLSIADHGGAWTGVAFDDGNGGAEVNAESSHLDMVDIRKGLAAGLGAAGIPKLDVLNMSACLMGSYEVAQAAAGYTDVLVGAEEISLAYLFDMEDIVRRLSRGGVSPEALGKAFVDSYAARGARFGFGQETQSFAALDLDRFDELRTQVRGLTQAMRQQMGASAPALAEARADSLVLGALEVAGRENPFEQADLGDLMLHLQANGTAPTEVLQWAGAVRAALARMVLHQRTGTATAAATGLSIYLPLQPDDAKLASYRASTFGDPWGAALGEYFASLKQQAQAHPLQFAGAVTVQEAEGGVVASAPMSRRDRGLAIDAQLVVSTGLPDGSTGIVLLQPAVVGPGGKDQVAAGWDTKAFSVVDADGRPKVVTGIVRQTLDGFEVRMIGHLRDGEIDAPQAELVFTGEELSSLLLQAAVVEDANGSVAAIKPSSAATVEPTVGVSGDQGVTWQPITNQPLRVSDLEAAFRPLPSGTAVRMRLSVTDQLGQRHNLDGSYTTR